MMGRGIKLSLDDCRSCVNEQWIRPVKTQYVIQFKKPIDKGSGSTVIIIAADRVEIKGEHLILYKKHSIVYFCPIERIDNFYAREV
jgi:hypothetical protein